MLSVNPGLSAADVRATLRGTARAFPNATCNTATCGAGIVDAGAAVVAATVLQETTGSMATTGMAPSGMLFGGGGGGGCTIARGGAADAALPLLVLWAALVLARRARNGRRSPRASRA